MHRLFSYFAPRSRMQFIALFSVLELLILGYEQIAQAIVDGPRKPLLMEMALTVAVSAPFVIFVLIVLRHQAQLQDRLEALVRTDALTLLPNRRAFFRLGEDFGDLAGVALLMIDVDHFKKLNDTYGHAHGDECLVAVAERMRALAEPEWVMGRLGGEEFVILIPDCPLGEAWRIARSLTGQFEQAHTRNVYLPMTASVGVAAGQTGLTLSDLMRRADEALYAAKTAGRACAVKWSDAVPALPSAPQEMKRSEPVRKDRLLGCHEPELT